VTATVNRILEEFEALPDSEKHELASEIIRWSLATDHPPLRDEDLLNSADSLFSELDQREALNGRDHESEG
jgi:hypothetical protein